MSFIKWNKKDILGIPSIDKQHKEIYEIVNNLHDLKDDNKSKISKQYKILLAKFIEHFDTEEDFMKERNIISLFSHKLEHERALEKYTTYFEKYKANKEPFDEDILHSLKTWLVNHAEMKDNKLKQYAKE